jgi:hypothetical protein
MTRHPAILAFAALLAAQPALASVEEALQPGDAPIVTTWYAARSAPAQEADRGYVAGMRPHHAGAARGAAAPCVDPPGAHAGAPRRRLPQGGIIEARPDGAERGGTNIASRTLTSPSK